MLKFKHKMLYQTQNTQKYTPDYRSTLLLSIPKEKSDKDLKPED